MFEDNRSGIGSLGLFVLAGFVFEDLAAGATFEAARGCRCMESRQQLEPVWKDPVSVRRIETV